MKLSEVDKELVGKLWHQTGPATMGGDPEYFVADSNGKILNADAFFPGKENPIKVKSRRENVQSELFFDGIQAEMAVAYSTCREYLADNIRWCWEAALAKIPSDHKIVLKPSAKIQREVIEQADPEARRFGCAPDFNAYTLTTNTPEMDASRHPFRYAGGHLHLGVPDKGYRTKDDPYLRMATTEEGHLRIIKFFDLLVTIPTLLLDNGPGARRRRSKYGKAGCFRPTPYGVEYRTPSCWWLKSPLTVSIVYGLARLAWTVVALGMDGAFAQAVGADEETVSGCINESDVSTVKKLWGNMRPYMGLIGFPISNPLNIGSVRTDMQEYVKDKYKGFEGAPSFKGKPVYSLAAFEYMLKNGLDSVISNDVKKDWGFDKDYTYHNGFLNGSYHKLFGNEDFHKFQNDFLENFFG
jgi:hypothetical protein